jgi:hypothetical protein
MLRKSLIVFLVVVITGLFLSGCKDRKNVYSSRAYRERMRAEESGADWTGRQGSDSNSEDEYVGGSAVESGNESWTESSFSSDRMNYEGEYVHPHGARSNDES